MRDNAYPKCNKYKHDTENNAKNGGGHPPSFKLRLSPNWKFSNFGKGGFALSLYAQRSIEALRSQIEA